MSFSFKPKSEEELLKLLPEGIYKFEVKHAEDTHSKAGNAMIKLTLVVWDNNGFMYYVNDYLLEVMLYKVKHFCEAVGIEEKYKQGKFSAEDCIGKSGSCKIKIDESEQFGSKNAVKDYVKTKPENQKVAQKEDDFHDDVPF